MVYPHSLVKLWILKLEPHLYWLLQILDNPEGYKEIPPAHLLPNTCHPATMPHGQIATTPHISLTFIFALEKRSTDGCDFQRQPGAGEENKSRASITKLHPDRWKEEKKWKWRVRGPFLTFPADWSEVSAGEASQEQSGAHSSNWPLKIFGKDQRATINMFLANMLNCRTNSNH